MTDTLPAGLTATAIGGSGWTCTLATLVCTRSDALAASASYPAITLTVSVAGNAASSVTNTATVSGGGETNTANDTASDPTTITPPPAPVPPGLVSWWRAEGNALDALGANNGTLQGGATFAPGEVGQAFSFNGSSSYVSAPDSPSLRPSSLTLEGWVNFNSLPTGSGILFAKTVGTGTSESYVVWYAGTTLFGAVGTVGGVQTVSSTWTPTPGTWHHVALTFDEAGQSLRLFVDGVSVASATVAITIGYDNHPLMIGAEFENEALATFFPGLIDEVGFYNRALTNAEIQSIFNAGSGGQSTLPDLSVTKTHSGSFVQGQTGATYTITVSNNGVTPTSGTVTMTDTLPTGLTATAIGGSGWTCTLGTLTCTRSDALAAVSSYPVITLTVDVASNAAASLTNTATVSGGGETNTANDTANDVTSVNTPPDLTVAKSHTGNFTQGQTGATYTITVTNSGGTPTSGTVTMTDTLPAGLTATAIGGSGWTCTLGTLTCTRSDALALSTSYPAITLTVDVANNAAGSLTSTATVSGGGEANTGNDTASDPTAINQLPDLTVAKSHTGIVTQGQPGSLYTITVSNSGFAATSGTVTLTDTLPAGLTPTAISGTGWTCTLGTLTCTRSDALAASASYPAITLTVDVANNAAALITNTATVSGGGEANTTNDTANDVTNVIQIPDLSVTKSHTGNFTQGQTGDTYTITVTNSGFAPTSGTVTMTDTLPAGLTATAIGGSGWTCTLGTLTCTRSDALAASASYPAITLTVNVANNAAASLTNTATVSGGGETNTANDTASDPTTINQLPDLTVTKSHTGNFTQGQTGDTYTITVTNTGFAATSGTVTMTDTLPAGLTATIIGGSGWACTLGTLTCTRSDALAVSASYPAITLTVNVANNAAASITNTATVSGGGANNTTNDTANDHDDCRTASRPDGDQDAHGQLHARPGRRYLYDHGEQLGFAATSGTVTMTGHIACGVNRRPGHQAAGWPSSAAGLYDEGCRGSGWDCSTSTLTVITTRSDALAPTRVIWTSR